MSSAPKQKPQKEIVPKNEKISFKEKLAYSLGGVGVGIQQMADNGIMTPIFVLGAGVSPVWMSLKAVIERMFDAFSDVLVGWMSDNTRSRWGRRRPYLFVGAFLMAFSAPILFYFNPEWSVSSITLWLILISLLVTFCYTVYNIPHRALFLEMTPNSQERTNLAAFGAYIGFSVQFVVAWMWKLTQLPAFANELGEPDTLKGAQYIISGLAVVVLIIALMPFFFCKERYYHRISKQKKGNLIKSIRTTFKNRAFMFLVFAGFFYVLGLNIKWGLDFYTKVYYIFDGNQQKAATLAGIQGTVQAFLSLAGISFFQWLSNRFSKRFALNFAIGMVATGSFSTLFLYIPEYPYLSMLPVWIVGPAGSGFWIILPSMMADVVDEDELESDERREGSFSAVFSWFNKVAVSAAFGLSGPVVVLAGFNVDIHREAGVPDDVLLNMRLLLAFLPLILVGIALFFCRKYPLTRETIANTKRLLEERRGHVDVND